MIFFFRLANKKSINIRTILITYLVIYNWETVFISELKVMLQRDVTLSSNKT